MKINVQKRDNLSARKFQISPLKNQNENESSSKGFIVERTLMSIHSPQTLEHFFSNKQRRFQLLNLLSIISLFVQQSIHNTTHFLRCGTKCHLMPRTLLRLITIVSGNRRYVISPSQPKVIES